ncbi:TonB-dependent siderophore receptor [Paraburkholderia tropica]|uniref:TonB-dependent siderophore receptor n=1 Tax=Paraburkholderia tropica TaxID=92647 RepID=UPI002AB1CB70|nr:TonB-dependent siderophore receptor [Paraburkholderia tropica]
MDVVNTRNKTRRPTRLSLAVLPTFTLAAVLGASPNVRAANTPLLDRTERKDFHIPPEPLGRALAEFALSERIPFSFDPALTAEIMSKPLDGSYSAREASTRLLAGSGLQIVERADGSYSLAAESQDKKPANETVLPTVAVTANSGAEAQAVQTLNPSSSVGSKVALSQQEIPQSISVVGQRQIEQQQFNTVDDVVRYLPGVKIFDGAYYSRGYEITTQLLDGVPTSLRNPSLYNDNNGLLGEYEQVEILRGAAGLYSLFGGAGGTLNLVRKMPTANFQFIGELSGGSNSTARGQADVSGPLNSAGTLRGRMVLSGQSEDLDPDGTWKKNSLFYGVLQADLAPGTTLAVGASHDYQDSKTSLFSVPGYSDYQLLTGAATRNLGQNWNRQRADTTTAFANLKQTLPHGWKGVLAFNYQDEADAEKYSTMANIDPVTGDATVYSLRNHLSDQQYAVDGYLSGPWSFLGRTHTFTVGATYSRETSTTTIHYCAEPSLLCGTAVTLNSLTPDSIPEPDWNGPVYGVQNTTDQFGLYGNARLSIADPLTLVLGARATWWKTNQDYVAGENPFDGEPSGGNYDGKITPYAGLIYDINDNYSAYISYTSIFQPQSSYNSSDQLLKPIEGEQYEAGLKGAFYGGALNTLLALFQITQKNQAMQDPNDPTGQYSVSSGKSRSQGIELTASGEIMSGMTLFGGYTYTHTKTFDDSSPGTATFDQIAPMHLFKLWASYQLPGRWHAWTIGAGTYVSSKIGYTDGTGTWAQGGYATLDATVAWQMNPRTTLALSGTNLFNRAYYDSVGGGSLNYYGQLRRVLVTLRYKM